MWLQQACEELDLEVGVQKCVLQMDMYNVHHCADFRNWLESKEYDFIKLLYVPGGCTGKAQVADLVVNRCATLIPQSTAACKCVTAVIYHAFAATCLLPPSHTCAAARKLMPHHDCTPCLLVHHHVVARQSFFKCHVLAAAVRGAGWRRCQTLCVPKVL